MGVEGGFLFVALGIMLLGASGLAAIGFMCILVFLPNPKRVPNRFGSASTTVTIGHAVGAGFGRALNLKGRSNRLDFFVFAIVVGILCGLSLCAAVILAYMARENPTWWSAVPLLFIPMLAVPSLSVAVRRLHDVNRSGWWLLLLLVFGYFILFYWFLQRPQTDSAELAAVFV